MPKHGIGDKCAGGVGGSPKPETYTRHGTSRGRRVCFVSIYHPIGPNTCVSDIDGIGQNWEDSNIRIICGASFWNLIC